MDAIALFRKLRVERLEDRSLPAVMLTVDATANLHAIDPRIYGTAFASTSQLNLLKAPTNRSGGNATSQNNWQLNASNRGADWYFQSIGSASSAPGGDGDDFIQTTRNGGSEAMLTIPTIGWVAKLGANGAKLAGYSIARYGQQTGNDWQWFPDAGNGIQQGTNARITWNNPNDASMQVDETFQRGWIEHLIGRWGLSASGGQRYYFLDNEPSLWSWTHQNVHPTGVGMEEVRNRLISYSAMIHAADPGAFVAGPEEWGWNGYIYSGLDQLNGNTADRAAHGNMDYLPWVLQQLKANDIAQNTRTLDAFTVHYYPQGSNLFSSNVTTNTQLLRNRSTRSLWDPNYTDESWINQRVNLISRLRGWADTHYFPGTPVGITEYNWGAEGHMNGATTQADVFGIFGRENLTLANRWTTPSTSSPTFQAMQFWRNFDGQGHGFGDVSTQASAPNPDQVSVFSSRRSSDGALVVAVINKNLYNSATPTATTQITVDLNNFAHQGTAQFWRLSATNPSNQSVASITQQGGVTIAANGTFTFDAAMQSVNMFVILPGGQPAPTVQNVQVGDGTVQRSRVTSLTVTFDATVTFAGPLANAFTLTRNGGGAVTFAASSLVVGGVTVVTLNNFSGAETESASLRDGRYTLTVFANQVSAGGQQMASNYTFGEAQGLFRYFGDMTGDRRVDIADFGFFSLAYLTPANYSAALDFNADGRIDIADFGQFSVRYFTTLP